MGFRGCGQSASLLAQLHGGSTSPSGPSGSLAVEAGRERKKADDARAVVVGTGSTLDASVVRCEKEARRGRGDSRARDQVVAADVVIAPVRFGNRLFLDDIAYPLEDWAQVRSRCFALLGRVARRWERGELRTEPVL